MIYTAFDPATAYLVAGILYLVMPLAAWLFMGSGRTWAANLWCLGSLLLGVGSLMLALRADWPLWLKFGVTNGLFGVGNLLHVCALQKELQQKTTWLVCGVILVVMLAVQEYCLHVLNSPMLRFSWILFSLSALLAWTCWLAFRLYREEASPSAGWLAVVYAFGSLAIFSRSVRVLAGWAPPSVGSLNIDSVISAISLFVMAVFGSVAFLGLYLERSSKRDLAAAAEREQQQASQLFAIELARLDRQRIMGEMAAALAHELSQPLTAANVQTGLLQREVLTDPAYSLTLAQSIQTHIDRSVHILNGIRKFIRSEEPEFKPVNVLLVLHEVLKLIPSALKTQGVEIVVRPNQHTPWILGDFVQLSQVVVNLLRNAIQARRDHEPLQLVIDVAVVGERMHLTMEDNGSGFSEEILAHVGVAFNTTKPDGMGVGIAISRRIVELHGGTLTLRNRMDQQGAHVRVDLPVMPAPPSQGKVVA